MTAEETAGLLIKALFKPYKAEPFNAIKANLDKVATESTLAVELCKSLLAQLETLAESKEELSVIQHMALQGPMISVCLANLDCLIKLYPQLSSPLLKELRAQSALAMQIAELPQGKSARSHYMQLLRTIINLSKVNGLSLSRHLAQRSAKDKMNISAAFLEHGEANTTRLYLCLLDDILKSNAKIHSLVYELLHFPVRLGGSGFQLQKTCTDIIALNYLQILDRLHLQHHYQPFTIKNSLVKQNTPEPLGFVLLKKCGENVALTYFELLNRLVVPYTKVTGELFSFYAGILPSTNNSLGMEIVEEKNIKIFDCYLIGLKTLIYSKEVGASKVLEHLGHINKDNMNLLQCIYAYLSGADKERFLVKYTLTEHTAFQERINKPLPMTGRNKLLAEKHKTVIAAILPQMIKNEDQMLSEPEAEKTNSAISTLRKF